MKMKLSGSFACQECYTTIFTNFVPLECLESIDFTCSTGLLIPPKNNFNSNDVSIVHIASS